MANKKKQPDFESRLARLSQVVEALEQEDPPLEKSMALYKEGLELVHACREQLEKSRYEITLYSQGQNAPLDERFENDEAAADSRSEE